MANAFNYRIISIGSCLKYAMFIFRSIIGLSLMLLILPKVNFIQLELNPIDL
jgi:hypothetical protein